MTSLAVAHAPTIPARTSTSGGGLLRRIGTGLISVSGTLAVRSTTTAGPDAFDLAWLLAAQTHSGLTIEPSVTLPSGSISELRRKSGLTWDQLARLFGVARRSVHFWVSGKALNASNEERLNQLLLTVRHIDRGSAGATRTILMAPQPDGAIPFELLASGYFDEVRRRLGQGGGRDTSGQDQPRSHTGLPATVPPPDRIVGALHGTVHHERGVGRAARASRVKKSS